TGAGIAAIAELSEIGRESHRGSSFSDTVATPGEEEPVLSELSSLVRMRVTRGVPCDHTRGDPPAEEQGCEDKRCDDRERAGEPVPHERTQADPAGRCPRPNDRPRGQRGGLPPHTGNRPRRDEGDDEGQGRERV